MRRAWPVVTLAITGCGRLGFDVTRAPESDGAVMLDGDPGCDPATPFGAPVPIAEVNVDGAYDSTFIPLPDERTAYFYSDRATANDYDLYRATRPDRGSPWTVARIDELASPMEEKEPSLSPDGSVLAFTSNRAPDAGGDDLWYATSDGTAFAIGGPITAFATAATDFHPTFQDGSDQFWFSSNITGTFSIYHATHLGGGAFGPAAIESDLDVAGADSSAATPSADGLAMYFRSDCGAAPGDYDIYVARRASPADAFGPAVRVTEVESADLDTPNWISPDGCRLYLSSSRDDQSNIYLATKP